MPVDRSSQVRDLPLSAGGPERAGDSAMTVLWQPVAHRTTGRTQGICEPTPDLHPRYPEPRAQTNARTVEAEKPDSTTLSRHSSRRTLVGTDDRGVGVQPPRRGRSRRTLVGTDAGRRGRLVSPAWPASIAPTLYWKRSLWPRGRHPTAPARVRAAADGPPAQGLVSLRSASTYYSGERQPESMACNRANNTDRVGCAC